MSPFLPLLALVARADTYGYELRNIVASEFAPDWNIDFAQLYRSLAKLRARGFVHVRVTPNENAPERKLYSLTAQGRVALERWMQEPAASEKEFRVKLRLALSLNLDSSHLVQAEQARLDAEREQTSTRKGLSERQRAEIAPAEMPLQIAGSDDVLVAHVARELNALAQIHGSSAGLIALASGQVDLVGTHLREPHRSEYNISFVEHLVAEQDILLVNLALREYGLMVMPDNPKKIRGAGDVARRNARLANRPHGSGARLWLQQAIRQARFDPTTIAGWSNMFLTYDAVARAILQDEADVGPGLRVTAEKFGLSFISLGQERFDFALPRALYETRRGQKFQEILHGHKFREYARSLPGYDVADTGHVIAEIQFGTRRKQ